MLTWQVSRPSRLSQRQPSTRLPEVHVEAPNPKPPNELALSGESLPISDKLWDLTNTLPMCRVDTRDPAKRVPEFPDHEEGDTTFRFTFPSPSGFVDDIAVVVVSAYTRRFGARFTAIGKPLKYNVLVVGPDATDPRLPGRQNAVVISRSPDDGFEFDDEGRPSGGSILFRTNGAQQGRNYFAGYTPPGGSPVPGAFPLLKAALQAANLPLPAMCINNIETRGFVAGSFPYGFNNSTTLPGSGFFESQILPVGGNPNPGLSRQLTASATLDDWLAVRGLKQDGTPFNQYAPTLNLSPPSVQDPSNRFAVINLASSAVTANFTDALNTAIFEPFKITFGVAAPCGEWDIYCTTQDHQAPIYPLTRLFTEGRDLPIDRQVIKNYADLPFQQEVDPSLAAQSLDWQTAWNWLQVYQPAGFTPWTTYPTAPPPDLSSDIMQRVVLESQTRIARACAKAAPHIPLMPSIAIGGFIQLLTEPAGTQDRKRRAAIPYMIRYMLNCCALGAREFYLFAPDWNRGQPLPYQLTEGGPLYAPIPGQLIRDTNYELISGFNKRFKARLPMRNRMWRFSA